MKALDTAMELWADPDDMIAAWDNMQDKATMECLVSCLVGRANRIADLGCGAGRYADVLSYSRYYGFDQSVAMLRTARMRGRGLAGVEYAVLDVFAYMSDNSYDAVLLLDVAQHQSDPVEAVRLVLNNWNAPIYVFTVLVGGAEVLHNSVVVPEENVLRMLFDSGMKILYTLQLGMDESFCSKLYGVTRSV